MSMIYRTLEEIKQSPPMTKEQIEALEAHVDTDFTDCPLTTHEDWIGAKRLYEIHPDWFTAEEIEAARQRVLAMRCEPE